MLFKILNDTDVIKNVLIPPVMLIDISSDVNMSVYKYCKNQSMPILITIKNNPILTTIKGSDRSFRTGFAIVFKTPKLKPIIKKALIPPSIIKLSWK